MDSHREKVRNVSAAVRHFYETKEKFRIFHDSTNCTRPLNHDKLVDISALSKIIKVDIQKQTVLVEPNVPMDMLVEETLK